MTTRKTVSSSEKMATVDSLEFPRAVQIPPLEEIDTMDTLLRRMSDPASTRTSSRYAYQDLEDYDYISEEALHRVVEDLQFGHDLRM